MAAAGSVLDAYRAGYRRPFDGAPLDGGIRAADWYVGEHDPLRATVSSGGVTADLALGVDPGSYFCGGLALELAGVRGGFLHVPNDAMLARPLALDFMAEVVARLLGALGDGPVLLTGFGPFPGVPDNPTAAFVADEARVSRAVGGRRVTTRVIALADRAGVMFPGMREVRTQLAAARAEAGAEAIVLALGVDSGQRLARPRFTVETQTWGMRGEARPAPVKLDALALALLP